VVDSYPGTPVAAGKNAAPPRPVPREVDAVEIKFLKGRQGNKLKVKGLDALEGTPLINIKPYLPEIDSKTSVRIGWVKKTDFPKIDGKGLKESKHVQ
jgi:tRNA (Thr-GGU) A37 N-methylase